MKTHTGAQTMKSNFLKEFKDFAIKGNVVDMAVGIIIGGAFSKVVKSLVDNVIMPILGNAIGGVSFNSLFVALDGKSYESLEVAQKAGAPILAYGSFIQSIVDFTIIAFSIFLAIKVISRLQKKKEEKPASPPKPSPEVELLSEIRDTLKNKTH